MLNDFVTGSRSVQVTKQNIERFVVIGGYNKADFSPTAKNRNFCSDLKVVRNGDTWNYDNIANALYWPSQGKLSFFAWTDNTDAPVARLQDNAEGFPKLSYTSPEVVGDTRDLLIAGNVNLTRPADGTVSLNFKHALACVYFSAQRAYDFPTYVRFDAIRLTHVMTSNVYDFTADGWRANPSVSKDFNFRNGTELEAYSGSTSQLTGTSVSKLSKEGQYLFLLPQSVRTDTEISVDFLFGTGQARYTLTRNFTLSQAIGQFEPGKVYNIILKVSEWDKLQVDVEVSDWVNGGTINVPYS